MISSYLALQLFCASFIVPLASSEEVPGFNYSNPEKWGSKDGRYARCSIGKKQSPIDINSKAVIVNKTMRPLTTNFHVYNASLSSRGINVQVEFNGQGELLIDGNTYTLKQMHWHTPSEHHFNGVQYAAELHQVHTASDGSRAVVAMLYKYGKPDPLLTMVKTIQKDQVEALKAPLCEANKIRNARPVQTLNGRIVQNYDGNSMC